MNKRSGYGSTFPDMGRTRLSGLRASFLCHCKRQERRACSWTGLSWPWSRPAEDDFAAAVAALDALDKAGHRALRVEQSYLRRALFKGPAAPCDLCGRVFEVEFLVAAHIKKRADCDDQERRDVAHVVMSACRFGCDELYERGYIAVGDDGQFILSHAIKASEQPAPTRYSTSRASSSAANDGPR